MKNSQILILILLLVNLIIALGYLTLHIRKKETKKGVVNFVTFLAFPYVGFIYMGIAELINLLVFQQRGREINYDELSFSKERMQLVQDLDVVKSLDSVSFEEALMLSNKKDRRQSLMEILKQDDFTNLIDNIKDAVGSEDKEISHYAATFISETSARYKAREQELRRQVKKNPTTENLVTYLSYVREALDTTLFEGLEKERFLVQYDEAAWKLYEHRPDMLLDSHVTGLFQFYINENNADKMEEWLFVIKERSMDSLECFKAYAGYCYASGDKEEFFRLLEDIRRSSVSLDNEALEWVRFFA